MDVKILVLVRQTLDTIHVSGHEDVDAMLGCMNALDAFIERAEQTTKNSEVNEIGG